MKQGAAKQEPKTTYKKSVSFSVFRGFKTHTPKEYPSFWALSSEIFYNNPWMQKLAKSNALVYNSLDMQ